VRAITRYFLKLIVLKNTLRCPLYGTRKEKKIYLVWFARKKIAKSVIASDALLHYMRQTRTIFSKFSNQKFFYTFCVCSLPQKLSGVWLWNSRKIDTFCGREHTICSLSFNGKQFLFFVEWGKISRKELKFFYVKITWKPVRQFFS
jgi:hypothetical protein